MILILKQIKPVNSCDSIPFKGLCHEISKGYILYKSKDPKKLEHHQCQERFWMHWKTNEKCKFAAAIWLRAANPF